MANFLEFTRAVLNQIKLQDPDEVTKFIGCLLLQNYGEQEVDTLSLPSIQVIQQVIFKAKTELHRLAQKGAEQSHITPSGPSSFSHPSTNWDNKFDPEFVPHYYNSNAALGHLTCRYFNRGFCKHGSKCRYSHAQQLDPHWNAEVNQDQIFSNGPLENLEREIKEILKSRGGDPVSIASLPMIYHEKYKKVLKADGYLTESQRNGKAGYSLTNLLSRFKNSIRVIDRPHGQNTVILAEDSPNYMEYTSDRIEPGPIVRGSRQIYFTFPAESSFTEDDVSNYFNTFGPVENVKIPYQQERMFGFVTFVSADTVNLILAKGTPHFVCGVCIRVKPYRQNSNRNHFKRINNTFSSYHTDADSELHTRYRTSQSLNTELNLAWKPPVAQSYYHNSMDNVPISKENFEYILEIINSGSSYDDKINHSDTNDTVRGSGQFNLPENPFAI